MLTNLPPPILEHIAFYLCVPTHRSLVTTPPSSLVAFLLCSKFIYETQSIRPNPHLYARIFDATFDGQAIRRRRSFEHVHVAELADELVRRWCVIKRFRGRVASEGSTMMINDDYDEQVLRTDLWTAFIMFSENDGYNAALLTHYARIDTFALQCIRPGGLLHRGAAEVNGGWTVDSEVNTLLVWIFWFTDSDRVTSESVEQRDEIIEALSPLYVGSFKYALPHAPISFFYPPSHPPQKRAAKRIQTTVPPAYTLRDAENPSIHAVSLSSTYPPCLVRSPSSTSSPLVLARPLPIPPVILSYVSRQELQFLRWPRDPSGAPRGSRAPATREEARRVGWTGPTGEDYLWFLDVRTNRVELGVRSALDDSYSSSATELSKRWDIDWARLLVCFHPFSDVSIPRDRFRSHIRVYEPGMLDGVWDGRWLMTPPGEFHELLHSTEQGVPLPPDFRPSHFQTPMTFRLKEHHSFTSNPDYNLPYDDTGPGALRAWIPERMRFVQLENHLNVYEDVGRSRFIGTYETFDPFESHRARRKRAKARRAEIEMEQQDGRHGQTLHKPVNKGSGPMNMDLDSLNASWDDDDDDENDDKSLFGHGVEDIIITAETEPPFAEAWGPVSFRGRVRPWDGLVVLERMPAQGTGRWIFRGYLHGGANLVGRWRETGTQFDASGWEGAWVVGRRA